jgi:hypothetical protein
VNTWGGIDTIAIGEDIRLYLKLYVPPPPLWVPPSSPSRRLRSFTSSSSSLLSSPEGTWTKDVRKTLLVYVYLYSNLKDSQVVPTIRIIESFFYIHNRLCVNNPIVA